jgi:organic hydroperoxide reductase OsmC/OhrA
MMGTLAKFLAEKKIATSKELFWTDVEGDIEDINGVLKITRIRVTYHLRLPERKEAEAKQALAVYLAACPGAQSVLGCIEIADKLVIEPAA